MGGFVELGRRSSRVVIHIWVVFAKQCDIDDKSVRRTRIDIGS